MKNRRSSGIPLGVPTLTQKDFTTDQDPRWCPGCGDYSILAQTRRIMPELGIPRENIVFISGIGCSSRFPYYMNTYGFHTIHGRAPTIASGVKMANPDLSVWVITGDGDALSIGGNHFIHLMRRNFDLNVLLFNNRIYGLTKGQYSPTSEQGKSTKSSPFGSLETPFNPISLALSAGATFVARSLDTDPPHLRSIIKYAYEHKGTSFIEIYQNCNIFNDGTFFPYTKKETKADNTVFLEHGEPLIFGLESDKGIQLNNFQPEVTTVSNGTENLIVHDQYAENTTLANFLARMSDMPDMPHPIGIFRSVQHPCYEDLMTDQIASAKQQRGEGDLDALLHSGDTWIVE
ncbi:2-oxoacid:ferredoxin oxidoreductase subunit beta [Candidatus Poribacteria bacterium]|nr:2-oxoacid:ferredoxin oxidoreductase subunit beta [Candidatus Poribacteria bacterium]MYF55064.1 2-oxoacid:ferredoxin oxidoreductase subunit beta [Candidatus Poribacteria bacterium]MYI94398.1 2-oxoacid:ferredoxin oxidoreductase subunit beta [Candidatus Poribacteria bacterium]